MINLKKWKGLKAYMTKAFSAIKGEVLKVMDVDPRRPDAVGYTSKNGTIHLSNDNELFNDLDEQHQEMAVLGIGTHELMHQLMTNFVLLERTCNGLPKYERQIFASLHNILEDPRIEHFAPQFVGGHLLTALKFIIAHTYKKAPRIDDPFKDSKGNIVKDEEGNPIYPSAFSQYMNAMIQFGDMGMLKGHFIDEQAKEIFKKTAPLFDKYIREPSARKGMKIAKEIFEIARPLWQDEADKNKLMEELEEMLEKAGKSPSDSGSGSTPSGEPSADGEEDSKSSRRKVSMREFADAMKNSGSGSGGSGKGQSIECNPETAEEAQEAAETAKECAAEAAESARNAEAKAKANPTDAKAARDANRAKSAAAKAAEAAKDAEEAAKESADAKAKGDANEEKDAAKRAGIAAKIAANAAKNASDAEAGKSSSGNSSTAQTAEDAAEAANDAADAANDAEEAAKEAESKSGSSSGEGEDGKEGKSGSSKSAEKARKAAERAKEAAKEAKEHAEASKAAKEAGDSETEAKEARAAERAAKKAEAAATAAEKAASGESGESSTGAEGDKDAKHEKNDMSGYDDVDNWDTLASDRASNGADPDYSTSPDCSDQETDDDFDTEFDDAEYELSDDDLNAIDSEIERCLEEVEREEANEEGSDEPLPDFDIASPRFRKAHTCLNRKITIDDMERASEMYGRLMTKLNPGISNLTAQLRRIFKADQEEKEYRASGKVNTKRLNSGRMTARVFDKRRSPANKSNLSVLLLIDESGSMYGNRAEAAKQCAIALSETLNNCNVPCYVIGFTADTEGADAVHNHYTGWRSNAKDRLKLLDITARSNNFDGYSIRYAGEVLKKHEAAHKLMIVISDGQPACWAYSGVDGVADTKDAIRDVRKYASVLGVAIGNDSTETLHYMYGRDFLHISNVNELFAGIAKKIAKLIREWD